MAQRVESRHLRWIDYGGQRGNSHNLFLRTAACDCTCDSWGNAGIREAIRPPRCERRIPKTFPSDQCVDANRVALHGLALPEDGAGDGNRTHGETRFRAFKTSALGRMLTPSVISV